MFEFNSALFQGDPLLQAIADDVHTPGGGLIRISRTQNQTDPAVQKVQLALLDWRPDCLPQFGADGGYGEEAAGAVHRFKAEELGVPEGEIIDDVGPLTVQRLDAIRAAAEEPEPISTVTIVVEMLAPIEGAPRVEGPGAAVSVEGRTVRLALQATGGVAATVLLDPPASDGAPVELPPLAPWAPPDGYVVQEGDTESSLATRFFDDAAAFAELSDHLPVVGEMLTLPPQAVPGWVAAAAEPLPELPAPVEWFTVNADEVLAAMYENAEPAPLLELVSSLEAPPAAEEGPVAVAFARAEAIAAFLALGADGGVAEPAPLVPEPESAGLDAVQG